MECVLQKDTYTDSNRALLFSPAKLRCLKQIKSFLEIPHAVQEAISAEKTLTLPVALPAYEELLTMLKDFKVLNPGIEDTVQASIDKLEEYFAKTRNTPIYALAMSELPDICLLTADSNPLQ
jgi:hypothetical protein